MRLIDADALEEEFIHHHPVGDGGLIAKAPTIEPKRKFIRIITTYHPDDIVCYEEYKGKPYFSIEYQENGETFIGYGTYNPNVLSRYLRDYFFQLRGEENG